MTTAKTTTRTLRLRLKDKHAALLREQARAVNFVWNYCNELSLTHWRRKQAFLSAYDMQEYTKGASKELGLHSQTVQAIHDVNAALNILVVGRGRLVGETLGCCGSGILAL
jgi:transposase